MMACEVGRLTVALEKTLYRVLPLATQRAAGAAQCRRARAAHRVHTPACPTRYSRMKRPPWLTESITPLADEGGALYWTHHSDSLHTTHRVIIAAAERSMRVGRFMRDARCRWKASTLMAFVSMSERLRFVSTCSTLM